MNSRRVATGASAEHGRHTRMMLEARAFVPIPIWRVPISVRIGHVPLIPNPAWITASRNVAQPVLTTPESDFVSDCLNA